MATEQAYSVIPKACANCRLRKVKCSRQYPCSSCEASGIQCQISSAKTQVRAAPIRRTPATATDQDEIKSLSQNIEEIKQSVQHLLTLSERKTPSESPQPLFKSEVEQSVPSDSPPSVYEGASSFASQVIGAGEASQTFARDLAQLAAVQDGLRSLRDVVHSNPTALSSDGSSPKGHTARKNSKIVADMQLPPAEFVVEMLKMFKSQPSVALLAYGFGDILVVEKLCQTVYFPTEPVTLGQLANMHGFIMFLLEEWRRHPNMHMPDHFDPIALLRLCEKNFETATKTYEVLSNPTLDNAKALRIAATRAQEKTDMNSCWMHICSSARHCLSLGLHRRSSLANLRREEADDRRRLFWAIYGLDKSVSLTLGQTPTIQDHDVDADLFSVSPDPAMRPYDEAIQAFLQLSRIEGMMYDRLYTASALRKPSEERIAAVEELSQVLGDWWQHQMPQTISPTCYQPELFDLIYIVPTKVVYYSLLTTLHRSAYATSDSPGTITPACYDAACRSIESHLEAFSRYCEYGSGAMTYVYLGWNLLYGAFTPIIVVFLHVISSFDGRDLELLLKFQQSLQAVQEPSEGFIRFRNACTIFSSVARTYVGSNNILPATAPLASEAIVRREDIQQAFDATQVGNPNDPNAALNPPLGWEQFDSQNLDGMFAFVDNWMDGTQQSVDFLNMDLGTM